MKPNEELVIVGGSLSGLTLALACANRGIRTKILERADGRQRSGAALGIDRALLMRTIGITPSSDRDVGFPVLTSHRNAVSWSAIHGWLREQASGRSEIVLIEGCSVLKVTQSKVAATVVTAKGEQIIAAVVVGADGYRSVVRAAINPATPHAVYAGYVLWRGLVDEREMPTHTLWPSDDKGVALVHNSGYRLVAYPVAGADGSVEPGRRRISFTWYDANQDALLQKMGCISQTRHVIASLSWKNVPHQVRAELQDTAQQIWPEPWSSFIVHALEKRGIFGTPVAEYFPERLRSGRLVVVGDAAHVSSPMTGRGFVTGTMDAGTLAECLGQIENQSLSAVLFALKRYENARLKESQALVGTSFDWSRAYLRDASFWRSGQSWPLRTL